MGREAGAACAGWGGARRATHPVAADAKVAVAQLDGLLLADHGLLLVPVVHQDEVVAQALVLGKLDGRGAARSLPLHGSPPLLPLLLGLLLQRDCRYRGGEP